MEENEINYEEISERMGYDILIGANNGEEIRRAINLTSWKSDYEIYQQESEPSTGNYLTFTALEDNSEIIMICECGGYDSFPISVEYSLDNGNTWNECEFEYNDDLERYITEPVKLNTDDSVMLRGNNTILGYITENDQSAYIYFDMQGSIAGSGDITSLINNRGGDCELNPGCFSLMFEECDAITTAPNLPSTTLNEGCYAEMFSGCTSLTTAPNLPATTLVERCYQNMFNGCSSLNYVKMMGLNYSYNDKDTYTSNWLQNVSSIGDIVFNSEAPFLDPNHNYATNYNSSFIPPEWHVYDDKGNQYRTDQY